MRIIVAYDRYKDDTEDHFNFVLKVIVECLRKYHLLENVEKQFVYSLNTTIEIIPPYTASEEEIKDVIECIQKKLTNVVQFKIGYASMEGLGNTELDQDGFHETINLIVQGGKG